MLPKVSAALSKFVAPVVSSASGPGPSVRDQENDPERRRGSAKRNQPDGGEPRRPALPEDFQRAEIPTARDPKIGTAVQPPATTSTQTLLQLISTLSVKRGISKILVSLAYRAHARAQRSGGQIRKGAVLDHKAE